MRGLACFLITFEALDVVDLKPKLAFLRFSYFRRQVAVRQEGGKKEI